MQPESIPELLFCHKQKEDELILHVMSERTSSNAGFLLKECCIGVSSYFNVVRTLKDQWFALAVGSTALSALIWLELIAF